MTGTVAARGEAVVPARPDEGIWSIDLSALDASPDAALADVGDRSSTLEALLDELDIPRQMRSTTGMTIREEFDHVEGKQVHRGFRAQTLLTVRLQDASLAGRLIQGAIERAKATVRGPVWWIAPDNPARLEACRRATLAAKRKAEAYAEALGLRLGAVAEVHEPSTDVHPLPRPAGGVLRAMAEPAVEVDPGELNVEAQVEVSFHLEG